MSKTVARNKKARFDFLIYDEYEAGVVLTGGEVKSIKNGSISLKESFVRPIGNDLWLVNANVTKWPQDNSLNYDPTRSRKLLLHRREKEKLMLKSAQEGYTIVPLSLYLKGSLIKVKIGLAKGRKKHEKKQSIIEKQQKRELHRDSQRFRI